jgi:hypothetical protein
MQQVEFRLYYDDNGSVLFYTCEKPEGKYIVIDSLVYAACRMDIKIVDGNIVKKSQAVFSQLVQTIDGIACTKEDISILVSDDYSNINNWDIQIRTVTGA